MDDNLIIRNQIIIPEDYPEDISKKYSDIGLSAVYSKNETNLIIFEKLLLLQTYSEHILNDLIILIIYNIDKTSHIDAIKLLIKNGVNLNYTGHWNWTCPIYCSVKMKNIEIIKLLIENGADINIKSCDSEYSLLMYLIENSSSDKDVEIIKLLISKNSQINYQDVNGITPLMTYFHRQYNKIIRHDIIKLLLDNKADIYIKDKKGNNIFKYLENKPENDEYYSFIFNYKNLENDHFCEGDINFIY